jgi:hypothetical protein
MRSAPDGRRGCDMPDTPSSSTWLINLHLLATLLLFVIVVAQPSWTSLIKENDQGNLLKITDDAVALKNGRRVVC